MSTATALKRRELFGNLRTGIPRCPEPMARRRELVLARRAMACEFSISFPAGTRGAIEAGFAALDEVDRLEQKLSAYRADSDIGSLNRLASDGPACMDGELYVLLRLASRIGRATGGAFDCTAGALTRAWGFFRGPRRVPSGAERQAALRISGWDKVAFDDQSRSIHFLRPGVELNLGAIGKGYAIDRAIAKAARDHGIRSALMQGGQSSIRALGAPPSEPRGWKVTIGDPYRQERPLAAVRLRNRALGTSGAANQFFEYQGRRYGHILDPRTGFPASGLLSASAIAPTAAEADALSTAFFVMGIERTVRFCREHPNIGAILVAARDFRNRPPRIVLIGAADAEVLV